LAAKVERRHRAHARWFERRLEVRSALCQQVFNVIGQGDLMLIPPTLVGSGTWPRWKLRRFVNRNYQQDFASVMKALQSRKLVHV